MPARHPALIFDFGNVIAFFDYGLACDRLGTRIGLSGEQFLETARERGLIPVLQRYERGDITSQEFSRTVGELMALEISHEAFATAWADIFRLNEPVAELVRSLKSREYTLVLGSNTNEIHADYFRRQFADTFTDFDRLVLSFEVGHIKPSMDFYLECADAAGAAPDDCIFIDDMLENVEGARAAGLTAILYQDTPKLITDLQALGVEAL